MIKVAALGAGYFSQFHLDGWRRLEGAKLVGISDLDAARAAATGAPVFANLEQMLAETTPDILDIIVPPVGHADAIRTGLAARVKAIICQKPFCTSLDEAREMAALAQAHGIPLIIHENFRFQPWYRAIKKAIEMERFLIHETAVHWVDTFRFLFGDPTAVYADLRRINPAIAGEDAGVVLFDHPNGVRSVFDGNRHLDHSAQNTRCTMGEGLFEGTTGTLTLYGDGSVGLRQFGNLNETQIHKANTVANFGGDCTYHLQKHVVNSLTGDFGWHRSP